MAQTSAMAGLADVKCERKLLFGESYSDCMRPRALGKQAHRESYRAARSRPGGNRSAQGFEDCQRSKPAREITFQTRSEARPLPALGGADEEVLVAESFVDCLFEVALHEFQDDGDADVEFCDTDSEVEPAGNTEFGRLLSSQFPQGSEASIDLMSEGEDEDYGTWTAAATLTQGMWDFAMQHFEDTHQHLQPEFFDPRMRASSSIAVNVSDENSEDGRFEDVESVVGDMKRAEAEQEMDAQHFVNMAIVGAKQAMSQSLQDAENESLKKEARDFLLNAAIDGRLSSALREIKTQREAKAAEACRQRARDVFFAAVRSGQLLSALNLREQQDTEQGHNRAASVGLVEAGSADCTEGLFDCLYSALDSAMAAVVEAPAKHDLPAVAEVEKSHGLIETIEASPTALRTAVQERRPVTSSRSKRRIIGGVVRHSFEAADEQDAKVNQRDPAEAALALMKGSLYSCADASSSNASAARESSLARSYEALNAQFFSLCASDSNPSTPSGGFRRRKSQASAMMMDLGEDFMANSCQPRAAHLSPARAVAPKAESRSASTSSSLKVKKSSAGFLPMIVTDKAMPGLTKQGSLRPPSSGGVSFADATSWSVGMTKSYSAGRIRARGIF